MNKRIKELAEQAEIYADAILDAGGDFHIPYTEKFAELLIQECAEFARQHNLEKADRSHMIHKAIKQHFGVEE